MTDRELDAKMALVEWVVEKLHDYLFDPEEKRAVIHLEFEKENGERQTKERWYVKRGYQRDGGKGSNDYFDLVSGAELSATEYVPDILDNPRGIYPWPGMKER